MSERAQQAIITGAVGFAVIVGVRIAMIGLRGLPARAGGVERHVEELAVRLVDRGTR